MGPNDYTVYDVICRNAQMHKDRDCIVFKDVRLTNGQYKEKCDRLAAGLLRGGVKKGDRLGILAHNCHQYMILYGAAAKTGAIVLPVNWRFQQDEVEYVLNDCTPKFVFAGPEYRESIIEAQRKVSSIEKCYGIGLEKSDGIFSPFEDLYSEKRGS